MNSAVVPFTPFPLCRDYYAVLGVGRDASINTINKAYSTWAALCHPDVESFDPSALPIGNMTREEYWELLNEAYEVLSNALLRTIYDAYGEQGLKDGVDGPNGSKFRYTFTGDCLQIYRNFQEKYSSGGFYRPEPESAAEASYPIAIPVTLEELFYGTTKYVRYIRRISVDGITNYVAQAVSLEIRRGTMTGTRLVKRGLGDVVNHSRGDATFVIVQVVHPRFYACGEHLWVSVPLSLKVALLGGLVGIPCIDGKIIPLMLFPPYRPGSMNVLPGEGMPIMNSELRGDLFVYYTIDLPSHVPERIKPNIAYLLDMCS